MQRAGTGNTDANCDTLCATLGNYVCENVLHVATQSAFSQVEQGGYSVYKYSSGDCSRQTYGPNVCCCVGG